MQIVHLRIDDRLIHGQVATLWANSLGVNRIMVIDDIVSVNKIQKLALKLAVPKGISLSVFPINVAAKRLLNNTYIGQRLLVIIRNPQTLLELTKLGLITETVNIGVLTNRKGTIKLNQDIYILPEEIHQINELKQLGIDILYQTGPNGLPINFFKLLEENKI